MALRSNLFPTKSKQEGLSEDENNMLIQAVQESAPSDQQGTYGPIKQLREFYSSLKPVVDILVNDPELRDALLDICKDKLNELTEVPGNIVKNVTRSSTGRLAAIAAVLWPDGVVAETFKVQKGIPPGGENLCKDRLMNCFQWFIANANEEVKVTWNLYLKKGGLGATWVYHLCLVNAETLANFLVDTLKQNGTDRASPCIVEVSPTSGVEISSKVNGLSTADCQDYKNTLGYDSDQCVTGTKVGGYETAVTLLAMCTLACCVATCFSLYCCYQKYEKSCTIL